MVLISVSYLINSQNAISARLALFGFNIFLALVVDPMHEFELGV